MSAKFASVVILMTAAAFSGGQEPGKKPAGTLRESILEQKLKEENFRLKTEVEALRKIQEEMHKELVKTVTKIEADRIVRDIKQRVEDAAHERHLLDLKADAARRRKEVQSPAILAALTPFISPGYRQPKVVHGTFLAWDATTKKMPVSLNRLSGLNALEDSMEGHIALSWIASDSQNDRPRWPHGHSNNWTDGERRRIARASELLRRYSDVLVELGYLAP